MTMSLTKQSTATGDHLLRLLSDAWPNTTNLSPGALGLSGRVGALAFLDTIEELSDSGMLGYEALVIDNGGPRIYQASITRKGRDRLRERQPS